MRPRGTYEAGAEVQLVVEAQQHFRPDHVRCMPFLSKDVIICYVQRPAPPGWVHARMGERAGLVPLSYMRVLHMVPTPFPVPLVAEGADEQGNMESSALDFWLPDGPSVKARVWSFLDDPDSSRGAACWSTFIMALIAVSVFLVVLQSMPWFWAGPELADPYFWEVSEMVITLLFTFEYIARLATYGGKRSEFMSSFMNVIDLLAISPMYIELLADLLHAEVEGSWLRVLRLARTLRILKLGKYSDGLRLFAVAMVNSMHALMAQLVSPCPTPCSPPPHTPQLRRPY